MFSLSLCIFAFLFVTRACKSYWCLSNSVILFSCVVADCEHLKFRELVGRTGQGFENLLVICVQSWNTQFKISSKGPFLLDSNFCRTNENLARGVTHAVCTYVGLCVLCLKMLHYLFSFLELLVASITSQEVNFTFINSLLIIFFQLA